jgi:DNA-binding NarL/FixJ family response regulator
MSIPRLSIIDSQKMFVQPFIFLLKHHFQSKLEIGEVFYEIPEPLYLDQINDQIVVIDISIFSVQKFSIITDLVKNGNRVIVLTNEPNHNIIRKVMQIGAHAYVLKSNDFKEFEKAYYEVLGNRTYLGSDVYITPPTMNLHNIICGTNSKKTQNHHLPNILTKREKEILRLVIQTKDNREISEELYISEQTVVVHKKNIMKKFGMRSTMNLIRYTVENGIVETL